MRTTVVHRTSSGRALPSAPGRRVVVPEERGLGMYGDTAVVRALARAMREQAADIHGESAALLARADAVPWTGLIAAAEHQVQGMFDSLGGGISGLTRSRLGHWLTHADLPPPGHLAWLEVRVPRWLP